MNLFNVFSENYIEWEDYSLKLFEFEYWEFVSDTAETSLKNLLQKQNRGESK